MSSRSRFGSITRYSSLTVAASIFLVFILLALSQPVRAASEPIFVWGKVVDSAGNPISGASVEVWNTRTNVVRTDADGTDSNGIYACDDDFTPPGDYIVGDTLQVNVSSTLGSKSNQTVVTVAMSEAGEAEIWVEYDTAIPEFGTAIGAMVAAFAIGAVSILVLRRKRS